MRSGGLPRTTATTFPSSLAEPDPRSAQKARGGLWKEVEEMNRESRQNEDVILNVAFTAEEVEHTLARMKKRKASGPDGLMAEHLQEAGTEVQI